MKFQATGLFPVNAPAQLWTVWTGKIHPSQWTEVGLRSETRSLRALAAEYGVSHEAVRRTLRHAKTVADRWARNRLEV